MDIENHIIYENLNVLERIVKDGNTRKSLNKEDLQLFTLAFEFMMGQLRNTIPVLVQEADLTSASNEIDGAITELNNYLGNETEGHLVNARSKIRTAVNRIKTLPKPIKGDTFDFTSEIVNFKKSIANENSDLDREFESLKQTISEIRKDIDERKQELVELGSCIDEKRLEIDNLNKEFRDQYNIDRASHLKNIEQQKEQLKNDTSSIVEYLELKKIEAAKIVNVIGNIGATGNFQKIANDHKKSAGIWRFVAIVFMTILSGLVVWSILSMHDEAYDWTKTLIRIIAAAALSYPATYAARESAKHRKLENYNRKLELELSSIEAFIELLPDEKKQDIKTNLAERYFGSTLDKFDDNDLKSDKDFSIQAIERLFNAVKTLKE
jgi:hypothetical protein